MGIPVISMLVPTMGNPWHLDTTVRSALQNCERGTVEVNIFSNCHDERTDEVVEGFRKDGLPARLVGQSKQNEGVSCAVNVCAAASRGSFIYYTGDDYYLLPGWDAALLSRVVPGAWQYLTPRSIERTGTNPSMYAPHDFGNGPDDFRETDLLTFWDTLKKEDVVSRYGPPFVAAGVWKAAGGFDEGYWPGFGTDPDFAISIAYQAKQVGAPYQFLGVGDSGIYHFGCITTARMRSYGATQAANIRFQTKWGVTTYQFGESIGEGKPPVIEVRSA